MKRSVPFVLVIAAFALGGCISTVGSIVTAPVKAVGWTADKLTTSQSESDRNSGRKMRKQEAKQGREDRKRAKEAKRQRDRDSEG